MRITSPAAASASQRPIDIWRGSSDCEHGFGEGRLHRSSGSGRVRRRLDPTTTRHRLVLDSPDRSRTQWRIGHIGGVPGSRNRSHDHLRLRQFASRSVSAVGSGVRLGLGRRLGLGQRPWAAGGAMGSARAFRASSATAGWTSRARSGRGPSAAATCVMAPSACGLSGFGFVVRVQAAPSALPRGSSCELWCHATVARPPST